MKVTQFTRSAITYRRKAAKLHAEGYERVSENGHPLWELIRGGRVGQIIVDAQVVGGTDVFIKIAAP